MKNNGFTLVELIVVTAMIGIVLAIATLPFSSFSRKSNIERETREMLADINTARTESVFRKLRHAIILQPNSYIMKRYSSQDEPRDGDTTKNIVLSKGLNYQVSEQGGTTLLEFDIHGFTNDTDTILVLPSNSEAAYDCLVISTGSTNIGKMEGGSCVKK